MKDRDITPIAHAPDLHAGMRFRTPANEVAILRPPQRRALTDGLITASDSSILPYQHAAEREAMMHPDATAAVANGMVESLRKSSKAIQTGIELEGTVYTPDGKDFLAVHDGVTVTFADAPPERFHAQLEVVTNFTKKGELPSTPLEIAHCVGDAVMQGVDIAERRGGMYVISSVPEGGSAENIQLTDHPYIREVHARGQTGIHPDTPEEARKICETAGVTDIIPFNGEHRHTSNPILPETGLHSSRIAYAKGLMRMTQLAQLQNFSLANTRHFVGTEIAGTQDVRAIVRRTTKGAHGSAIANDAYEMVEWAIREVEEGRASLFSRLPAEQHDRVRPLKECGSTESVVGAANPDLRLDIANMFFDKILDGMVYQGMENVGGDETKLLDHLKDYYGFDYLFSVLPAMTGDLSCLKQDILFNKAKFAGVTHGKSYADQMDDMRTIARRVGSELPGLQTEALIVDHVYGKVAELPKQGDMKEFLDLATGIKPGIATDYKTDDIAKNLRDQAEGTKKQALALQRITSEYELLQLFGIMP